MSKSDWEFFYCSEVKEFIEKECLLGNINHMTHKNLYELLEKNGFIKK
ncbi:hypothetical protein [Psychrilyobacter atlanticus]|nr:hypothetical protein [Psychrilyobacter atlanticus]